MNRRRGGGLRRHSEHMRRRAILTSFALLGSSLAAIAGATTVASPASALAERWCSSVPAPCIESLTVNGVPKTSGATVDLPTDLGGYREIHPVVTAITAPTDVVDVVVRTGSFVPDRMFGRMGLTDVDTGGVPGDRWIRIVGSPVIWAEGCTAGAWPWPCPSVATADSLVLDADVAMLDDRTESTIGMYVGTNAAYNGIFFDEQPDGSHALTTEVVAPHTYHAGGVVTGSIRFRLSYDQMRSDMGIPNPETLTPGSLSGTVNGGTGGGAFTTWHDPDGGGFFIQASGFTFSLKKIKVTAAHITPTRPTLTRAKRVSASKARLRHTLATPRGARVTGYLARCTPKRGAVVRGTGAAASASVVVKGLRRATAYTCQVAAQSKAGRSAWSPGVRLRSR